MTLPGPVLDLPSPLESALEPQDFGLGLLFWRMRDAAVVGDAASGRIALLNPAAERLFGYAEGEANGQPLDVLVAEPLKERHRAGLAAYAETGRGVLIETGIPVELTAVRKDGGEIAVELGLTPLSGPDANRRYVLAVIRDATERRRVESERQALLAAARDYARRLEELATLKAAFMSMVAHELGNPVAAVRGLADLLLAGHLAPAQQASLVEAIRAEADLLRDLVADVQAAAAVERDEFEVRPRPVAMAMLLAEATAFARSMPGGHPVTAVIEDVAATSTVVADPGRIGQVLRNLLTNAAKHTPAGTPIELRARCVGRAVRIEVADRGPGIQPYELERVFEKFGRGRDAAGRKVPGSGLGLYLSRRIVRAYGGELTVSSVAGEGTIFAFELEIMS